MKYIYRITYQGHTVDEVATLDDMQRVTRDLFEMGWVGVVVEVIQ